jgi:uncharacterized protein (UPF0333 family)
MTFKKYEKRGQAVLEYFILTVIVVSVILYFTQSGGFTRSKNGIDQVFRTCVGRITQ